MASDAVRLTETLRIATAAIGAQVKDKTPDQLRKKPPPPAPRATSTPPRSSPARRSPPLPRTPRTGSLTPMSRSRPTTRRRTTVTSSSLAARPRPTPPICARRRRTRRPQRSPCSPTFWRATSSGARRSTPEGVARPARRDRRAQDLRGDARRARLSHSRLQGRQRIDLAARLFQLFRAARAQDGFFALRRGFRVVQHRDLERGPADLRRGPQARRALRDRAAPGPALGGRRVRF